MGPISDPHDHPFPKLGAHSPQSKLASHIACQTVPDTTLVCIFPRIKKADMDPTDPRSYRPISNLPVSSKLLERLVARQLLAYLNTSGLLPRLQSAYRPPHHSTETAILRVLSDILLAIDAGDLSALVLLDLSTAFDAVDHNILLRQLEHTYQLGGVALEWFRSYLVGRRQHVRTSSSTSVPAFITCGVPQGSVLGPILFLLYTADLLSLIESHGFIPHLYASHEVSVHVLDNVLNFAEALDDLRVHNLACVQSDELWTCLFERIENHALVDKIAKSVQVIEKFRSDAVNRPWFQMYRNTHSRSHSWL